MVGTEGCTHHQVLEAAEAAGIFMHQSPYSTPAPVVSGKYQGEGSQCPCHVHFHALSSVIPARVHGGPHGGPAPGAQGCEWCLNGRLHSSAITRGDGKHAVTKHGFNQHPFHPILDLETGVRGRQLSGGFAQSVSLARVLLRRNAKIIILDEALGQVSQGQS